MSSNVGLSTPRGSGTSGYVQRNLSSLKPRQQGFGQPYSLNNTSSRPPEVRKPDAEILKHDKLRQIEVRVLEHRDKLEDEGKLDDDEIEEECDKMRAKLVDEMERGRGERERGRVKGYKVHEAAEVKAKESEKLRRALGVKALDGDEHPMARQDRRKREEEARREAREAQQAKREEDSSEDERGGGRRRRGSSED